MELGAKDMLNLREAVGNLESQRAKSLRIREEENGIKNTYDPCIMMAFNRCDSLLVRSIEEVEKRFAFPMSLNLKVSLESCESLPTFSVCRVCQEHMLNSFSEVKNDWSMWSRLFTGVKTLDQLAHRYVVGLVIQGYVPENKENQVYVPLKKLKGIKIKPRRSVSYVEKSDIAYHGSYID